MGQGVQWCPDRVHIVKTIFLKYIQDVSFLGERDSLLSAIASNLDAKEVVCLAQIRDWEVFHKLPLKLGNFVD